jgi:uncharacterized protein YggE
MAWHSRVVIPHIGYNAVEGKEDTTDKLYLTDSTFIISAKVVLNRVADLYVVTFSTTEEANDISTCNDNINSRIDAFRLDLKKKGFLEQNTYVDMTTQNKIYDYKINDNKAEQYLKGFELQKNVIVRFAPIEQLDEIVISASKHGIYDMVKVDYIVDDLPSVYTKLFDAASKVIEQKKTHYSALTHTTLATSSSIYGEKIYSFYPPQLYKSYKAYESSQVYGQFDGYVVKDLRKSTTFYYDPIHYSGFDSVINPAVTEPMVEFVLELQVKFSIVK